MSGARNLSCSGFLFVATFYYGIDDTKNDGSKLHGAEWDILTRIVSSQLQGALKLHGPGIVALPDDTAFRVEEGTAGEPLSVRPGAALIPHGVGIVWAIKSDPVDIPLSAFLDDGVQVRQFVHVAVRVATVVGAPDTRENAAPLIAISDQEVLDGHLLLAEATFTAGELTALRDRRSFSPALGHNALLSLLLGSGRLCGFNPSVLAPTFDAGTLNITLPAGSRWFIGGKFIELDTDLSIEAPTEATNLWGVLSLDESGLPTVLESDWVSEPPVRGAGVLGKITTDTTQITAFTETTRDIIQTETGKQQRFEAIEARLTLLEGGAPEGGDGSGGFTYVGTAPWLTVPDDSRPTSTVIAEMLDSLKAELVEMIRNGGVRPQQTELSKTLSEMAIVRQEVAKCQLFLRKISNMLDLGLQVELGLERSQSANIVGIPGGTEIYGIGGEFPDHLGATTLTMNADGSVEP